MLFRLTQALNARVNPGVLEALPLHDNPLLDWSAHLFPVGRSNFILISNTVSMLSAVVPGRGVASVDRFRDRAFDGVRACLTALGYESLARTIIPADSEPVRFAKALSRSVSGSMNELVTCAEFCTGGGELTLPEVGERLNDTLLSALAAFGSHGYGKPGEAFRVMVRESVPHSSRSGEWRLEHQRVGRPGATMPSLCETCESVRGICTARSRFLLCALSFTSAAYPKYPPQPVVRCDGYRPRNEGDEAEPDDRGEAG